MRLAPVFLNQPTPVSNRFGAMLNSVTDMEEIENNGFEESKNKNDMASGADEVSFGNDKLGGSWKTLNLTTESKNEKLKVFFPSYQRKHRQQQKKTQKKFRGYKNFHLKSKNSELDFVEGDDFFGSTQEIITFAEKGRIYKKHRLVEFSPPSNKIPKQKLQIRNAVIHIRIEKASTDSSTISGQLDHQNIHRHKNISPREPNLKIWIFQLMGNDFASKGFDQVATLCTSLRVDHKVLGWQKIDITETVQFWYSKHQEDKLRLLIDCTGCGNRYILHLFDRKLQHSLFSPAVVRFQQSFSQEMEEYKSLKKCNTSLKLQQSNENKSKHYYYHYKRYIHHRFKRKSKPPTLKTSNIQNFDKHQLQQEQESSPHSWSLNKNNRNIRATKNLLYSHKELMGVSYEVDDEYHIEDRLNPNRPFLVLHTEPNRSRRVRRRAVDCSGALHGQCCKESFYVSFKALGWDDWIIAPRGYFANYCRGDCTGPYRTPDTFQTFHAHFIEEYRKMGLLNGMQPCCAPVKFSSMSLIYYGDDGIIKRDLPKMVVDECGCP